MKTIASLITVTALLTVAGTASADKAIYDSKCSACHATGVAGAPKFGDKEAWAPRIATGMDTLLAVATKGKGAMPPKGTCMDCTEEQLKSTIQYMVDAAK
ncbi:MAG TPA: cytochrome c5 family protein [Gammaproteobacteria bacterium]|nr:cytochrome c5 family protein [Gammaproteobacteria bacterium]